ncbi:DUF4249 family protein [Persicobacter sp. CCB-QB2]|uniref:DUF4249 family protein n=1 Tax=Persicobacter sp. CCB-QB2 TaxID=1561025 RepID=UPI0006A97749|nr:DUF4249 family protein [Persicobacter sp. CCB-QB2]
MKKILFFILGAVMMVACESVIHIDISSMEPLLVVNGVLSDRDPFVINVSGSKRPQENDYPDLKNPQVRIFHEGKALPMGDRCHSDGYYNDYSFLGLEESLLKEGERYEAEVSAEGFKPLRIPFELPERNLEVLRAWVEEFPETNERSLFVKMQLPQTSAYFEIILHNLSSDEKLDWEIPFCSRRKYTTKAAYWQAGFEFGVDDYRDHATVFSREMWEEDIVTLEIKQLISGAHFKEETHLALRTTTEAHYRYDLSFRNYSFSKDNILAEPVNVYSNIPGGAGILTGSVIDIYEIENLPEAPEYPEEPDYWGPDYWE